MEGTITLNNPILIEGVSTKELNYDTEKITPDLFAEAEGLKNRNTRQATKGSYAGAMELDYSFHMYLGAAAIVAAYAGSGRVITMEDVLRIHGSDIKELTRVGRSFMIASDESAADSSEELSETTSEPITSQDMSSESDLSRDF